MAKILVSKLFVILMKVVTLNYFGFIKVNVFIKLKHGSNTHGAVGTMAPGTAAWSAVTQRLTEDGLLLTSVCLSFPLLIATRLFK